MNRLSRRAVLAATAVAPLGLGATARASQAGDEGAHVRAIVDAFDFNGVILLGRSGQPTFSGAYGVADAGVGRAAAVDDRYMIASISKWLTVLAVLRLVEAGTLVLDAPVASWLTDYRVDTGQAVTLRHLLNNTSGIPNLYGPAVQADPALKESSIDARTAVARFCSGDPVFAPGQRFDYAITNWIMVLAIIEVVTGERFEAVIDRLVLAPLGLRKTGVTGAEFAVAGDAARAYASLTPPVLKMSPRPVFLAAAGGYYSTARDLLTAADRVFDQPFLSPAMRGEMMTVGVPDQRYALGGRVARLSIDGQTRTAGWETGRTDGYRSVLGHVLEDRRTVVVLNNTDLSQQAMDQIALQLLGAAWA